MDPSTALHTIGDVVAAARLALHVHDLGLSWLAYCLTSASPHNHWTGAGLQRLVTDPPMSWDRWGHLPAWRVRRLLDARARGYIGTAHLAEGAVVLVALMRVWYLRRRARGLRRVAARAAGWPSPSPHPWLGQRGQSAQPGIGSGLALAGVVGLARVAWLGVRIPFMAVGAAGALPALVTAAAHRGGGGAARATATKGKEPGERGIRALKRGGWLSPRGWPVGTVGRGLARRTVTLNPELQCAHVMVSGSPGSGKSKTQLVPWVLSEIALPQKLRASMILMDPKPDAEITSTTIAVMERAGWRVWVYDPFSVGSMRLNVLGLCADAEEVEALIDAWVIGVIGVDHPTVGGPAKRVLASVAVHLRALAEEGWARVSLADVARFIAADEDGAACLSLAGIKEKAKGITAMDGARDATRVLLNPHVAASMEGQDWDTAAFLAVPTIVYVPIMMGKRKSTTPFYTTLFPMMFSAFTHASHGLPLTRRVRVLADEFANMSPVKNFDDFISAVRYLNVGVAVASQGVNDIKVMYSGDWPRIEASLTTRIHLPRKGLAIIAQEAMPPIAVTTHFWMKRDRLMARRVRRGQRRLTKALALARQARGQGTPSQAAPLAAPAAPVALIEGPAAHDGDTRRLDTTVYTSTTEPLALPVALVEPGDSPGDGEEEGVDDGAITTEAIEEEEEEDTRAAAAAAARREAADLARERRQERASTGSTRSTTRPRQAYKTHPHVCAWGPCGLTFDAREDAAYCSPRCRAKAHYAQRKQDQTTT